MKIYRIYDKQYQRYVKSPSGTRIFQKRRFAESFLNRANLRSPGRYELHVFNLERVYE